MTMALNDNNANVAFFFFLHKNGMLILKTAAMYFPNAPSAMLCACVGATWDAVPWCDGR
jgi:hypothetical protein